MRRGLTSFTVTPRITRGLEVYRSRPILYGCGDFLSDYEGIPRHEEFRHDLVVMYFAIISCPSGRLVDLKLTPLQIRNFRLQHPSKEDRAWLRDTLDRDYRRFGVHVAPGDDGWKLDWER